MGEEKCFIERLQHWGGLWGTVRELVVIKQSAMVAQKWSGALFGAQDSPWLDNPNAYKFESDADSLDV